MLEILETIIERAHEVAAHVAGSLQGHETYHSAANEITNNLSGTESTEGLKAEGSQGSLAGSLQGNGAAHGASSEISDSLSGAEVEGLGVEGGEEGLDVFKERADAVKKTEIEKAAILEEAHRRHVKVTKNLFRKLMWELVKRTPIMSAGLGMSYLISKSAFDDLSPAFDVFGAYLGMEAAKESLEIFKASRKRAPHVKHALGDTPNPDKVLDEPLIEKPAKENNISVNNKRHGLWGIVEWKNVETSLALMISIYTLPLAERAEIVALYSFGMPLLIVGGEIVLIGMEDRGQHLEAAAPKNPISKALARTKLPALIGFAFQEISPRLFHALPWATVAVAFITSGRVNDHASPLLENIRENTKSYFDNMHFTGHDATGIVATMAVSGAIGVAIGFGAYAAWKVAKSLCSHAAQDDVSRHILRSMPVIAHYNH